MADTSRRPEIIAGIVCLLPLLLSAEEPEPLKLGSGLTRMKELSEEGNTEEALRIGEVLLRPDAFASWRRDLELGDSKVIAPALELAEPALELFGLTGHDPGRRAAVHYARGVVQLLEEDRDAARTEFGSSTTLAGGGELRFDASYNLGTTVLLQGEEAFANIPEVAGLSGAPPMQPSVAQGTTPPAEEEEDPLEKARALYLEAKDLLVERLRLDWRDEDTRANIELVMRRLRQLDEIEQQREQEQQEQEQQDQEQSDESEPQDQGDQEKQENQENDPQEGEQEQQDPSEQQGEEESQQEGQPQERTLTEEEVQRLLNMLQEYEEQGKEALEQRRQGRQRRTERDW